MARGYTDDRVNTSAIGQYQTDVGELAARLGSIYTILRSGRVLFIDTFEVGLNSWAPHVPAGGAIAQTNIYPFSGTNALLFTDGNALNDLCWATKGIPLVKIGTYGLDTLVHWNKNFVQPLGTLITGLYYRQRTISYTAQIKINPNTGAIQIYETIGGIGVWTTIFAGDGTLWDAGVSIDYHYVHFTVDLQSLEYKLLTVDDRAYDLSGHSIVVDGGASVPGLIFLIGTISTGFNQSMQIDNVVILIDEQ